MPQLFLHKLQFALHILELGLQRLDVLDGQLYGACFAVALLSGGAVDHGREAGASVSGTGTRHCVELWG